MSIKALVEEERKKRLEESQNTQRAVSKLVEQDRFQKLLPDVLNGMYNGVSAEQNNYKSYFYDDKGNYLGGYNRPDIKERYSSFQKSAEAIRSSAKDIVSYYQNNWDYIDQNEYTEVMKYVRSYLDALNQMESTYGFFSVYDTPEKYKAASLNFESDGTIDETNARQANFDSVSARMKELEAIIAEEEAKRPSTSNQQYVGTDMGTGLYFLFHPEEQKDGDAHKSETQLAAEEEYDYLQKQVQLYKQGNSVWDNYFSEHYTGDDMYGRYNAENSEKTVYSYEDMLLHEQESKTQNAEWDYEKKTYVDKEGNAFIPDGNGNYYHPNSKNYVTQDPLGTYLQNKDAYYNTFTSPMGVQWDTYRAMGKAAHWDELKTPEIEMYYHLLHSESEGMESAMKYLSDMEAILDQRANQKQLKAMDDLGVAEQIIYNVASVPATILGGIGAAFSDIGDLINGDDINPYSDAHNLMNWANNVRAASAEDLNELTNNAEFLGMTLGDAYQAVMSGVDSFVGASTLGVWYAPLMATNAFSSTAQKMYEQGATKEQIAVGATLGGVFEAAFERLSIGHFVDKILKGNTKSLGDFILKTLAQGGVEASEEMATEIANMITEASVMRTQSEWYQAISDYKNSGMSDGEAYWQALLDAGKEVWKAGMGGFISGGLMGGGGTAINYAQTQHQFKEMGQSLLGANGVDPLLALANDMHGVTALEKLRLHTQAKNVAKWAENKPKSRKTQKAVGRLSYEVNSVRANQNKADIVSALEENGYTKSEAKKYADIFAKERAEFRNPLDALNSFKEITRDNTAYNVLHGIIADKESSVNKRNAYHSQARATGTKTDESGNTVDIATGTIVMDSEGKLTDDGRQLVVDKLMKREAEQKAAEVKNDFDVSSNGKTLLVDTGEVVENKEFVAGEDGKLQFKINGKQTISPDKVAYKDAGEALVVSAIVDLGADAATSQALLEAYKGKSEKAGKNFASGIKLAFKYGEYGMSKSNLLNVKGVTEDQADLAYNLGKEQGKIKAEKTQAFLDAKKKEGAKKASTKGEVIFEDGLTEDDLIKDIQKASYMGIQLIAEMSPLRIHLFASTKDGDSYRYVTQNGETSANGWYTTGTNEIWIDINAGNSGDGLMMHTMAHEITHFIRQYSPKKWKAIADYILNAYGRKAKDFLHMQMYKVMQRSEAKHWTPEQIEDEAYEEIVSDALSGMLTDGTVVQHMADLKKKDAGLWQTIKDAVMKILKKWGVVIDAYKDKHPEAAEAGLLEKIDVDFKKLQKMFAEAFADASDTYNAVGETKNTAEDGGVKFDLRHNVVDTNGKVYADVVALNYKTFNIVKKSNAKYIDFIRNNLIKKKITVLDQNGDSEVIEFAKSNERVLKDGAKNAHRVLGKLEQVLGDVKKLTILNAEETAKISTVFERNQEHTHQWLDQYGWEKRKSFVMTSDGTIYPVTLHVAKARDGRNILYSVSIDIKKGVAIDKEASSLFSKKKKGTAVKITTPFSKVIPQKEGNVKRKNSDRDQSYLQSVSFGDMQTAQKMVDEAAKVAGYTGSYYHGSQNKFTVFDIKKAKSSGTFGKGFYFSDSETHAKQYGNTYKVFLKMENPLRAGGHTVNDADLRKFIEAVAENEDYSIENYGTYDVDKVLEKIESRDAFAIIRDVNTTAIGDFAEAVKLFNEVCGTEFDAVVTPMETVVFKPEQIKSADPVTYDDNDNVIPLSERFDSSRKDIRYSNRKPYRNISEEEYDTFLRKKPIKASKKDIAKVAAERRSLYSKLESEEEIPDIDIFQLAEYNEVNVGYVYVVHNFDHERFWIIKKSKIKPDVKSVIKERSNRNNDRKTNDTLNRQVATVENGRGSDRGGLLDNRNEKTVQRNAESTGSNDKSDATGNLDKSSSDSRAGIKRQDRDPALSKRVLLASALESVAENSHDQKILQEYKEAIDKADELEAHLAEINKKIYQKTFAKGARDGASLARLNDEKIKTANRLNVIDKKVLRLEASKYLKALLDRERDAAYEKGKEEGREAVKKLRDAKNAKLEQVKKQNQEARKKAIEGRHKTEVRNKIRRVVKKLNHLLVHGTKERNVKLGLQDTVRKALAAAEQMFEKDGGENIGVCLDALHRAYTSLADSQDDLVKQIYNEHIAKRLNTLRNAVGDTTVSEMSLATLQEVYDAYKAVSHMVTVANQLFRDGRTEYIEDVANSVITQIRDVVKKTPSDRIVAVEKAKEFWWQNLKPVYAFERIGSDTLMDLYWDAVSAEGVYARDIVDARTFMAEQRKTYHYEDWDLTTRVDILLPDGRVFSLNVPEMMSIYAYSKREQADKHMSDGGFIYAKTETFKKRMFDLERYLTQTETYRVDKQLVGMIVGELTAEQRSYVDKMQEYLSSVMGAKGNEVSRQLYGIDLFKELFYFPLMSAKDFLNSVQSTLSQTPNTASLVNTGMAAETVPHARNPLVLQGFDDVWIGHVDKMSQYHALVLPIENMRRVVDYTHYSPDSSPVSVKRVLDATFGEGAKNYITGYLTDLNGGVASKGYKGPTGALFSKFKKAAVSASLSTIVQQPTAIVRAMAYIDPKYFTKQTPKAEKGVKLWEEVKKYAPIAVIKEMGGFDVGSGMQAKDYIGTPSYHGKNVLKGFLHDKAYRNAKLDDVLSKGMVKADELGWCMIWNAVKSEVAANEDFEVGSEEFFEACGQRFTRVVAYTQVYDSVNSRSGLMRSDKDLNKFATAFMGEPTTSVNMLYNAILQASRGGSKAQAARTIGATYASIVLAAVAASAIYALRDDDDDEAYLDKWAEAFGNKLSSELLPLNMIPYVRDLVSVFQGWDVERPDMSIFADIKNAYDKLEKVDFSDAGSVYTAIENFGGNIAALFGLPLRNLLRDTRAIVNAFKAVFDDETPEDIGDSFVAGFIGKERETGSTDLYDAIVSGSTQQAEEIASEYTNAALRKALRENDERVRDAAEARISGDSAEYARLAEEIVSEGYFSQEIVMVLSTARFLHLKGKKPKMKRRPTTIRRFRITAPEI